MVALQVTVAADPRTTAEAADSEMKFPVPTSSTSASTSQPILVVAAMVEFTVIVKVTTILPVNVVDGERCGALFQFRMRNGVESAGLRIEVAPNPVLGGGSGPRAKRSSEEAGKYQNESRKFVIHKTLQ